MVGITGIRIKERRQELNMTQEQVGDRIGVSKATVNKYEVGTVTNFSRPRIEKLAEVLECSPGWLLGWDDLDEEAQKAALGKLKAYNTVDTNNGVIGFNNGIVNIEQTLSKEEKELLRIYRELPVKDRLKLLNTAFELEEGKF